MSSAISLWTNEVRKDVPGCPGFTIEDAVLRTLREFCAYTHCWVKQLEPIALVAYQNSYAIGTVLCDPVRITHIEVDGNTLAPVTEKDLDDTETDWRNTTASVPTRYLMGNDLYIRPVYTPNKPSDAYFTLTDLTFTAPDTITSTAGGFVTGGLSSGQTVTVNGTTATAGATLNNRDFVIESVTETTLTVEGGVASEGSGATTAVFGVGVLNVWAAFQPARTATTVEDFLYNDYLEVIADGAKGLLFGLMAKPWTNGELAQYFTGLYKKGRSVAWHEKRYGLTTATSRGVSA